MLVERDIQVCQRGTRLKMRLWKDYVKVVVESRTVLEFYLKSESRISSSTGEPIDKSKHDLLFLWRKLEFRDSSLEVVVIMVVIYTVRLYDKESGEDILEVALIEYIA